VNTRAGTSVIAVAIALVSGCGSPAPADGEESKAPQTHTGPPDRPDVAATDSDAAPCPAEHFVVATGAFGPTSGTPTGTSLTVDRAAGTAAMVMKVGDRLVRLQLKLGGSTSTAVPAWRTGLSPLAAPDACPGLGYCPCEDGSWCDTGRCALTHHGLVCLSPCADFGYEGCPDGFACTDAYMGVADLVDPFYGCVSRYGDACRPCTTSDECRVPGHYKARCVDYGAAGHFCGNKCKGDEHCAPGYHCTGVATIEGDLDQQCVRTATDPLKDNYGRCICSPRAVAEGARTACAVAVPGPGTATVVVPGVRACTPFGLSACDAPAAASLPGAISGCDDD